MSGRICAPAFVILALTFLMTAVIHADEKLDRPARQSRPITKPRFDPDAKRVPLFDGIENGSFKTKVIANGPYHGSVLVTNTTTEPLTAELPDSFVAVQVLKQFQFGNQQNFGNGPGLGNNQGGGGQQQSIGGGLQQPGGGNNNNPFQFGNAGNGPAGGGPGFFSIPPEKTVKVKFVSACLEHGKANPTPKSNYQLVKTKTFTNDAVLREVIRMVGEGRLSQKALQAAVWHQANNMSWNELSAKHVVNIGLRQPYFTRQELQLAKQIVETATEEADSQSPPSETTTVAKRDQ